jgi:HD superfamily phosphodiesterase
MLAYFETKNIGKKVERAEEFGRIGDDVSQRDMEFDWADEAIHAGYGRTWLRRAVEVEGRDPNSWADVVKECEELVAARVARATDEERKTIYEQAERLMDLAEKGAE